MSDFNRQRAAFTRAEARTLRAEVDEWLKATTGFRHARQIARLREQFDTVTEFIEKRNDSKHETSLPEGEFALHCARTDEMLAGFRQVFAYYRDRLKQRSENTTHQAILEGADEILWSCFRPMFKELTHTPPLTFLDATRASHWAWESINPLLTELRSSEMPPALRQSTPVPLIGLPFWSTSAPWSLVLVAHEAGHHVFADLGLRSDVEGVIEEAARACDLSAKEVTDWALRASEIYADLFSVAAMGSAAVEALMLLVRGPKASLTRGHEKYPPPAARLSMMARLFELRFGGEIDLGDLAWTNLERSTENSKAHVVSLKIAELAHAQSGWFVPKIDHFERTIDDMTKAPSLWGTAREAGRIHGAALFRAWYRLESRDQADPEKYLPKLKPHLKWLVDNGEKGSRAATEGAGSGLLAELQRLADIDRDEEKSP